MLGMVPSAPSICSSRSSDWMKALPLMRSKAWECGWSKLEPRRLPSSSRLSPLPRRHRHRHDTFHKARQNASVLAMAPVVQRPFSTASTVGSHSSTRSKSRRRRLHEKSYPCNDQEHSFPVASNAPESNSERCSGPVMRGEKGGEIRPVGTISRDVMRTPISL